MFENPLCFRDLPISPLFANWGNWEWVKTAVVWAAISFLIWLLLQFYKSSRKRWFSSSLHYFVSGFLILTISSFLTVSQGWFLPINSTTNSQAIVVLGRGEPFRQERVDFVSKIWHQKKAPLIFVSGRFDAQEMIPLFLKQGIPAIAIAGENCSATTSENAIFSATILKNRGINQVFLVTDTPHLWRSLLEFRDEGLNSIPYPMPLPQAFGWQRRLQVFWREYVFMGVYGITKLLPAVSIEWQDQDLNYLIQDAQNYNLTVVNRSLNP